MYFNFILCSWTAGMLSDIIMLLSRAGKVQDAYTIVQRLSKLEGSIGVPSSPDSLIYFAKAALQSGSPSFSSVIISRVNLVFFLYVQIIIFKFFFIGRLEIFVKLWLSRSGRCGGGIIANVA